jgi:hypothetical protein
MSLFRQIAGWALLLAGILVIVYGLYASFNIFIGEKEPPGIFSPEKESVVPSGETGGTEGQLQQLIQEQLEGILPASSIFGMLNLVAWSIFAGILIFGGAQISGLGIKLIKLT